MTTVLNDRTIYMVSVSPTTHFYAALEAEGGWSRYNTMKRAEQFHPDNTLRVFLTEREWIAAVKQRTLPVVAVNEQPGLPPRKYYIKCMNCLEVFEADEPHIAYEHFYTNCDKSEENYDMATFELLTEEEAF